MNPRLGRVLDGARQVLLTVGAVVGVLCILVTVGAALFGLRPLVFRSGSMSPTIDTGALAIARSTDAGALAKGDIVSVPTAAGERVTHRIVTVQHQGDHAVLTLQGDANNAPDAATYDVTHADRVLFSVPRVGYLIGWLTGPAGLFLLGLYAAFLLSVIVRKPSDPPDQAPRAGGRRKKEPPRRRAETRGAAAALRGVAPVVTVAFATATFAQVWALPTLAAWTDAGSLSGTALAAYTVPAPPNTNCTVAAGGTGTSRGVDLTWPASASPLLSYSPAVTPFTATTSVSTVGGNTVLQVRYDPSVSPTNAIATVSTQAFPSLAPSWLSPTTTWKFVTGNNKNIDPTCQELNPPSITITAPTATTETASAKGTAVKTACGNKYILCGTATDASTVGTVTFILQKGSQCWDETLAAYTSDCSTWQSAGTGSPWTDANGSNNLVNKAYPGAGSYSLTVRAEDSWGNVATVVRTFTLT